MMNTTLQQPVTNPIHRRLIHEHRRIQDYAFENDLAIRAVEGFSMRRMTQLTHQKD